MKAEGVRGAAYVSAAAVKRCMTVVGATESAAKAEEKQRGVNDRGVKCPTTGGMPSVGPGTTITDPTVGGLLYKVK